MAASATPRPTAAEAAGLVRAALTTLGAPRFPVAIAFSGGADSSALLLAAVQAWPGQVRALHVHHGLQAAADVFERHCRQTCHSLDVPLAVAHVDARHKPGDSPEDAARRARYEALARMALAQGVHTVWLAQHADDQAETLLLALSRGAGLPGLASMAPRFERHGMCFERPLLQVPAAALRAFLMASDLAWTEDPSNADTGLTRNRIRRQLLPALEASFPAFRETFARSARHAAQAQALLAEVAQADLEAMGGVPDLKTLQGLSAARQANVLRHWLRTLHGAQPSAAQLDELLAQVAACRTRGHRIRIKVATGFVERSGSQLRYSPTI